MSIGAFTEEDLDRLNAHSEVLAAGTFCPDPSPFHADLVKRAFLRLVYLEEKHTLAMNEIAARDAEIARLRGTSHSDQFLSEPENRRVFFEEQEKLVDELRARIAKLESALQEIASVPRDALSYTIHARKALEP